MWLVTAILDSAALDGNMVFIHWLCGFPGITVIFSGNKHCPNYLTMVHPWVDLEIHKAAPMLAILPFSVALRL